MIPLRVAAENYGPYGTVEWEIPAGLTAIVGVNQLGDGANSNGSGKTKLLELVPICLFGPTLPWSEYLTVGSEETTCTVELEFEHGGDRFLVKRSYDSKGRGKTTLDLEVALSVTQDDDLPPHAGNTTVWQSRTRSDQRETQALIEQTIGLSEATFAHSVFAGQGSRHFADPTLAPRERKAILTDALNLGVWDELLKVCRVEKSEVEKKLEAIEIRLMSFQSDLDSQASVEAERDGLKAEASLVASDVAACEKAEAEARCTNLALRSAQDIHSARITQRMAAQERLSACDKVIRDAQHATEQIVIIEAERAKYEPVAARVDELVAEVQAIAVADALTEQKNRERLGLLSQASGEEARAGDAEETARTYVAQAEQLISEIGARLNGNPGSCDHCGQTLAGAALEQAISSLRRDVDSLTTTAAIHAQSAVEMRETARLARVRAAELNVEAAKGSENRFDLHAEMVEAQHAVTTLATLRERLTSLQAIAAAATTEEFRANLAEAADRLLSASTALDAAPPFDGESVNFAARNLERASTNLIAARATERQVTVTLAAAEEKLRNLAVLAERAQESLTARTELQARLDVLTALARSYGRDGIPALILEAQAIPQLETEANRVLEALDARLRFELVTQRENKTGGLKDTLDVLVHGERGTLRYESYSGGEQTRLAFALRIALAQLIDAGGLLALDELTFLDATGIAKVVEVLRGLTKFRSVALISHDERLAEAFDQVVTVVRDDSGSRIEEAA